MFDIIYPSVIFTLEEEWNDTIYLLDVLLRRLNGSLDNNCPGNHQMDM